ncbi:hypothetical protein PILCRDRAFT_88402 [Piloderma croceum F 1598]|uniref:Cytochrome P450 n=1 Tax=Piloderma croceum (strain F 1598) TaxID=765440 RepID=A0A0C3BZD3_PILCF|nr:hypothetical protein PILCRDRAFT_88402 [Piloderma croceum F 1598]
MSCVATELFDSLPEGDQWAEQEQVVKGCAASEYADGANTPAIVSTGGSNTVISPARCFTLAIAMYPDVQKTAQAEIDAVVGRDRLPDLDDIDSLPFINAIIKEILRWQPAVPFCVPHRSTQDEEYDGFFIPKGTNVMGNTWSILHNPDVYPEPEKFRPQRFLTDGKLNPDIRDSVAAFGYGRRICPGQFMATQSLFLIFSSIPSNFNISPPLDEFGNPTKLRPAMLSGVLSTPSPFKCVIKSRSDAAAALIRESVNAAKS